MEIGTVIDDRTFERKLLRLATEFQRRADLLTEGNVKVAKDKGVPALLKVLREQNRPMTYREVMEYLPIAYTNTTRWAFRSKFTQAQKRGLVRIFDHQEGYNYILSPRWVLEDIAMGTAGQRAAKLKDWFDREVDELESRRVRRTCVATTALEGIYASDSPRMPRDRNAQIAVMRGWGMKNREIGARFGISPQRVDQIIQKALRAAKRTNNAAEAKA